MMKQLKGRFALMALLEEGKWLMVGCRDYPLAIGENNSTVYFCTDTNTLTQFSPSMYSVGGVTKTDDLLYQLISIRDSHTRTAPYSL